MSDVIRLASDLIAIDTVDRNETEAAAVVSRQLADAGCDVVTYEIEPGRANLVASYRGGGDLVLSGHLDTVPYVVDNWTTPPLEAFVRDGRLYGRGASDMKAGVAAMCSAVIDHVGRGTPGHGFMVALTIGEETGCTGARALVAEGLLPDDAIVLIAEATGNELRYGHKGATWLTVTSRGVSAHASRPELGHNAIVDLATAIESLRRRPSSPSHDELGEPTVSIGTITGGTQTNVVPDIAKMTVDVRTVPGFSLRDLEAELSRDLPTGSIERTLDLEPVWTDAGTPTSSRLAQIVRDVTGRPVAPPRGVTYFTDAAVMPGRRAYVLGPGDPTQPHSTHEWCRIDAIHESVGVYGRILDEWERGLLF